jgi:protein-S-isoprenylcysteine O-methyltransferase Ste14
MCDAIFYDRPKVKVMPPLVFFVFLICAGVLERWMGIDLGDRLMGLRHVIAWPLLLFAAYLALSSWLVFVRAGTHVDPRKPALKMIEDGPFRITRNPMYLPLVIVLGRIGPHGRCPGRSLPGGKIRRSLPRL